MVEVCDIIDLPASILRADLCGRERCIWLGDRGRRRHMGSGP